MTTLMLDDGTLIYYELTGETTGIPLVFLHGYACTGRDWEGTAAALAVSHPTLVFDFRGHDRSADSVDITLETLVDDVQQILNQLGLGRVVVVGHSMGGMAGLEFTRRFPERIIGLITADAFPHLPSVVDVFGGAEDPVGDPYGYDSVFDHQTDPANVARIRQEMGDGILRLPPTLFQSLLDFDLREQLAAIPIPVRLLLGARRKVQPEAMPDILKQLGYDALPNFDWTLIDSHHFIMLEQPEATLAAIQDYLTKLDAKL